MTSGWGVRILASIVTATVVAALVAAIILMGPPSRHREHRLDERRVQDLMGIQRMADVYWERHKSLPPDLVTRRLVL